MVNKFIFFWGGGGGGGGGVGAIITTDHILFISAFDLVSLRFVLNQ